MSIASPHFDIIRTIKEIVIPIVHVVRLMYIARYDHVSSGPSTQKTEAGKW